MIKECLACPLKRDCSILDTFGLTPNTVEGLRKNYGWKDQTVAFELVGAANTAVRKKCPQKLPLAEVLFTLADGAKLNGLGKPTKETIKALLVPPSPPQIKKA